MNKEGWFEGERARSGADTLPTNTNSRPMGSTTFAGRRGPSPLGSPFLLLQTFSCSHPLGPLLRCFTTDPLTRWEFCFRPCEEADVFLDPGTQPPQPHSQPQPQHSPDQRDLAESPVSIVSSDASWIDVKL